MQAQALFEEHFEWAASVGQSVGRNLPPSFDVQDLIQIALIQHWRCVENYDATPGHGYTCGVPYRLYAYQAIKGAVLMSCRRKNYREATHEELNGHYVDERGRPDAMLLARENWRNQLGPQLYRKRVKVRAAFEVLPAADAYLVRRIFLEGADMDVLARAWQMDEKAFARLVGAAVRRLKRLVRNGTPAATAPRSRPLASARDEHRTTSHRSTTVLGWQPLRPPLRNLDSQTRNISAQSV
jgi:DNA-directed RNA polymerase specialized sigma24 family protein